MGRGVQWPRDKGGNLDMEAWTVAGPGVGKHGDTRASGEGDPGADGMGIRAQANVLLRRQ